MLLFILCFHHGNGIKSTASEKKRMAQLICPDPLTDSRRPIWLHHPDSCLRHPVAVFLHIFFPLPYADKVIYADQIVRTYFIGLSA